MTAPGPSAIPFGDSVQAWDVLFFRAGGVKARINLGAQLFCDPWLLTAPIGFTHCALAFSETLAIEAYPRAIKGAVSATQYPAGVRIVPVADLLAGSGARYGAQARLRADASHPGPGRAQALADEMLGHRYGLRRFAGLRTCRGGEPGSEWVGCADLVVKMLAGAGLAPAPPAPAIGPGTLWRHLLAKGWRPIAGPASDP